MWPEYEILWPVINPWTFPVARARPEPKPQAQNPARTMKKVARPSPTLVLVKVFYISSIQNIFEFGDDPHLQRRTQKRISNIMIC